jgi:uncharacterized membrane protein YdjX (TVP38/TMEM64 family)
MSHVAQYFDGEKLQDWIEPARSHGWGSVLFLLLYVTGALLALPAAGFNALGGVLFGFMPGLLINLIGVNAGACLAFGFSRTLGRGFVQKLLSNDKMSKLESMLDEHGLRVIIAIRILPILPYNVVNFGTALTRVSFKDYFWGSLIGTFPATLLFTYFAHAIFTGESHRGMEVTVVLAAIGFLILAGALLPKAFKNDK